jgi:hypothetical protein
LETTPICVFGTDKATRSIADRISNLALATTPDSQIVSAAFLASGPSPQMFMVGLELKPLRTTAAMANSRQVNKASADKKLPILVSYKQATVDKGVPKAQPITAATEGFPWRIPLDSLTASSDLPARIATAVRLSPPEDRRIQIDIKVPTAKGRLTSAQEQICAVTILDALCAAFA